MCWCRHVYVCYLFVCISLQGKKDGKAGHRRAHSIRGWVQHVRQGLLSSLRSSRFFSKIFTRSIQYLGTRDKERALFYYYYFFLLRRPREANQSCESYISVNRGSTTNMLYWGSWSRHAGRSHGLGCRRTRNFRFHQNCPEA